MSVFDRIQLVSLAAFLVMFVGRSVFLRTRQGVKVFAVGARGKGVRGVVELVLVVPLALWVLEIAAYALHSNVNVVPAWMHPVLVDALAAKVVGVVLETAGLALFASALAAFGASWRVGIDERTPGALVTSGVFAYSRNPIFFFFILYAAGTFLIYGTAFFLVSAILVAVGVHVQILQEERFLARTYGDAYRAYRAQTARYLSLPSAERRADHRTT
jgi:protein-S-isoprenylcysteine O-methyltransferase Ste14